MDIILTLAKELDKLPQHVENVVRLLDEGNTIPFIARYRKELHGAMDDTALRTLEERLQYLRNLQERREAVKKSIEEQGKLTEELSAAKASLVSDLLAVSDSVGELEGFWLGQNLLGLEYGPDELAALIEDVTVEDIVRAAATMECDMVYFLKGTKEDEEDEDEED